MRIARCFKGFLICFLLIFLALFLSLIVFGVKDDVNAVDGYQAPYEEPDKLNPKEEEEKSSKKITEPIILWWSPFTGEPGRYKTCGNVQCFFTVNRHYKNNPQTKVFMFYGTDFKYYDLPLPRKPHHEWGLLHEESPKNNFLLSFEEVMTLFNHTATFRRESDYPITTQYIESKQWLESKKHLVPTKEKNKHRQWFSPLIYAHSDCGTPSDRDNYMDMLMQRMNIDSYGSCLHNKDLPDHLKNPIEGMFHEDFFKLISKYKFAAAMENGICNDYITEKLWRPLHLGTVPVVLGSPKVKDLLPSNKSAIVIDDFDTVEDLANYLTYLDQNDEEYEKYLEWKKTGITNKYLLKHLKDREWSINDYSESNYMNFIDGFECFVCKRIHENLKREKKGKEKLKYQANVDHYGCPAPSSFEENGKRKLINDNWQYEYFNNKYYAKALRYHIDRNLTIDRNSIASAANRFRSAELR